MTALLKLVPASQITYGTDYPYFGFGQFAELQKLGLSVTDLDDIGHENATRLIPRCALMSTAAWCDVKYGTCISWQADPAVT
jgi:hypothetical protein